MKWNWTTEEKGRRTSRQNNKSCHGGKMGLEAGYEEWEDAQQVGVGEAGKEDLVSP